MAHVVKILGHVRVKPEPHGLCSFSWQAGFNCGSDPYGLHGAGCSSALCGQQARQRHFLLSSGFLSVDAV